jgi:hypothetical protein
LLTSKQLPNTTVKKPRSTIQRGNYLLVNCFNSSETLTIQQTLIYTGLHLTMISFAIQATSDEFIIIINKIKKVSVGNP